MPSQQQRLDVWTLVIGDCACQRSRTHGECLFFGAGGGAAVTGDNPSGKEECQKYLKQRHWMGITKYKAVGRFWGSARVAARLSTSPGRYPIPCGSRSSRLVSSVFVLLEATHRLGREHSLRPCLSWLDSRAGNGDEDYLRSTTPRQGSQSDVNQGSAMAGSWVAKSLALGVCRCFCRAEIAAKA